MKRLGIVLFALAVVSFGVFSCQKTIDQTNDRDEVNARLDLPADCAGPYTIKLESVAKVMDGEGWTWTWSIMAPEGVQALSHFNALIPTCEPAIEVLGAAWSYDGTNWNSTSISPVVDPSLDNGFCAGSGLTQPAIKFDLDGNGYFRLTVKENYQPGIMYGYYKSGVNTGCGLTCFEGISCLLDNPPPPEGCSFSQGFWFAKPISEANAWPGGELMMGGKYYSQQEGKALFFVSGNIELKRAFTQAATIKLSIASGYLTDPSEIMPMVNNIEGVLNGLPKLTPGNIASVNRGLNSATRKNLSNWAGAIGNYVDANHCELNP